MRMVRALVVKMARTKQTASTRRCWHVRSTDVARVDMHICTHEVWRWRAVGHVYDGGAMCVDGDSDEHDDDVLCVGGDLADDVILRGRHARPDGDPRSARDTDRDWRYSAAVHPAEHVQSTC